MCVKLLLGAQVCLFARSVCVCSVARFVCLCVLFVCLLVGPVVMFGWSVCLLADLLVGAAAVACVLCVGARVRSSLYPRAYACESVCVLMRVIVRACVVRARVFVCVRVRVFVWLSGCLCARVAFGCSRCAVVRAVVGVFV